MIPGKVFEKLVLHEIYWEILELMNNYIHLLQFVFLCFYLFSCLLYNIYYLYFQTSGPDNDEEINLLKSERDKLNKQLKVLYFDFTRISILHSELLSVAPGGELEMPPGEFLGYNTEV